ncbi:hypothetical protein AAW51_0410 [Caldimonas brevitalea]|uniref:protein-glutamate methylesterase n=1 Tax=Caldimonas brevitalea TaxID=413882 RepID=A0A0G3BIA3_9BURK|nr:hypothetical protein AAW51_0410 [Caldimonas brevitalea]
MPEKFTTAFATRLNTLCDIEVREAVNNDRVLPGRTLGQDKPSCVVYGMPKEAVRRGAVERGAVERSLPLGAIAVKIVQQMSSGAGGRGPS